MLSKFLQIFELFASHDNHETCFITSHFSILSWIPPKLRNTEIELRFTVRISAAYDIEGKVSVCNFTEDIKYVLIQYKYAIKSAICNIKFSSI